MTVKEILPFGDPLLRKKAKPVTDLHAKTQKILDDMAETLYAQEGRAGLAAPQVGYLRRLIVMDCGDGLIELINPELLESAGEQTGTEACLSYPGHYGIVKRAQQVTVRTLNRQGESIILQAEGYVARCIQHEIDHLDGVLFVDHVREKWLIHEQTNHRVDVLSVIRLTNQGVSRG
ncbi:peptide deformylase [Gorillibacterium sp. CAU 1737]|uniref:peptide deformylase n=1 Tax=Gorillibacterium sp. CAU 1737 TaxID=3140362 RepID=UPI003260C379